MPGNGKGSAQWQALVVVLSLRVLLLQVWPWPKASRTQLLRPAYMTTTHLLLLHTQDDVFSYYSQKDSINMGSVSTITLRRWYIWKERMRKMMGSFIICAIKAIKQNWMRWAGYVLHAWKTTVQTFCDHVKCIELTQDWVTSTNFPSERQTHSKFLSPYHLFSCLFNYV
jgi:hypothetical protein